VRILVMTSLYPPHFRGGAELSCQSHAEGLQKRGHEVFILTSRWGIEKRSVVGNIYRLLNYDMTSLDSGCTKDLHDPLRLRRRYDQFRRAVSLSKNYNIAQSVVATVQPDVAYVWHMESVSISPVLAAQDSGIPIVIRLPDYWLAQLRTELCLEPNPLKRWYRAVFSGLGGFNRLDTRHMLPNSLPVMQSYLRAGFPAESMHVIPNGVSSDLLLDLDELSAHPVPSQNGDVRLLFAGRLVSAKAPDVAIQVLAYLVAELGVRQARLDIIGEGAEEYSRQLRDMVTRLGLDNRVSFLGKMGHSQLLERYAEYDVLLLTSRWEEPFSRVMLEAMARGLPVVATNTGGTVDVISDGYNGLLVPSDNPMAMAQAVTKLLTNPELTQSIRVKALARIRAKYSLERIVEQVEGYLQTAGVHRA
jgi:glycogen(starch) synthase